MSTPRTKILQPLLLLFSATLLIVGCSSTIRSQETTRICKNALIELSYFYGGDTPVGTTLCYSLAGEFKLTPVGHRTRTSSLTRHEAQRITKMALTDEIESLMRRESEKGTNINPHEDFIGIHYKEMQIQRRLSSLPVEIRDLVGAIDGAARKALPKLADRYLNPKPR